MTAYVLIVISMLGGYISGAPITIAEFNSKNSCESAAVLIRTAQANANRNNDSATCVPK